MVLNSFYHPIYIADNPRCRDAIEGILRYIEERGHHIIHMGANQLADWWHARRASSVNKITRDDEILEFRCECRHEDGMIVKVPLDDRTISNISGCSSYCTKKEFGNNWLFLSVKYGESIVKVTLADKQSQITL